MTVGKLSHSISMRQSVGVILCPSADSEAMHKVFTQKEMDRERNREQIFRGRKAAPGFLSKSSQD